MARRRSRQYKQMSTVHTETVNDSDWSSIMVFQKQDDSMTSAYLDRVRISFVLDTDEGDTPQAFIFCLSTDKELDSSTAHNNDGRIISATATTGAGGVASLPCQRRITMNYDGTSTAIQEMLESTSGAPIYLHVYGSDDSSNPKNIYCIVESWGRWHKQTAL